MSSRAAILALVLAACGGSGNHQDMSAGMDMSSAACSAAGGHCITAGDGCVIGGAPGTPAGAMGCATTCCVALQQCNFPQCDGGTCECPMVGQTCMLSGDDVCTCQTAANGALSWSCSDD